MHAPGGKCLCAISPPAILVASPLTLAPRFRPLGWIYPAEIIPLYIRSKAVSIATVFNWACNFSLTFFTPPAFKNIQWRVYMIFGTFCAAAFVHVFFFFQESRGRSLEEMNEIFDNNTFAFGKIHIPQRTLSDRMKEAEMFKEEGEQPSQEQREMIKGGDTVV